MKKEKSKGMIFMGGGLCFGGPDIAARLKRGEKVIFNNDYQVEMTLTLEPRLTDQLIEVQPFFALQHAEVDIETPDPNFEDGELEIEIKDGNGGALGLVVNFDQAMFLKDILEYFIQGCDSRDMLRRTQRVSAPEEEDDNTKPNAARPS